MRGHRLRRAGLEGELRRGRCGATEAIRLGGTDEFIAPVEIESCIGFEEFASLSNLGR